MKTGLIKLLGNPKKLTAILLICGILLASVPLIAIPFIHAENGSAVSGTDTGAAAQENAVIPEDESAGNNQPLSGSDADFLIGDDDTVTTADDDIASGISGECSWVIDANGVLTIEPINGVSGTTGDHSWVTYRSDVTAVVIKSKVKLKHGTYRLFNGYNNCVTMDLEGLDVSDEDSLSTMFMDCTKLESVSFSSWDTSKITSTASMFIYCSSLKNVDLSGWDTSSLTTMSSMFRGCTSLESVDFSGWDAPNLTSIGYMFYDCLKLKSLDLSGFDTSKVNSLSYMFYNCKELETLNLDGWDTSNVTSMNFAFSGCSKLQAINTSGWNTSKVTTMDSMFSACSVLSDLDVSNFDTSNVTDIRNMFNNCRKLEKIDVSKWDVSNMTDMRGVFYGSGVRELDMRGWVTPKNPYMGDIFSATHSKLKKYHVSAAWVPGQNYEYTNNFNYFNVIDGTLHYEPEIDSISVMNVRRVRSVIIHDGDKDIPVDLTVYPDSYPNFTGDMTATLIFDDIFTVYFMSLNKYISIQKIFPGDDAVDPYEDPSKIPDPGKVHFVGWDKSYKNLQEETKITAIWEDNTYTVRFIANGGEGTMEDMDFTYGTAQNLNKNVYFRKGYTFLGWSDDKDAAAPLYTDGQSVINMTEYHEVTVDLYAVWSANTYNVKFDANGGEGTMADQKMIYDTPAKLTANSFTKEDYIFLGWNTDSSAEDVLYTDEQEVVNIAEEDITLYAVWKLNKINVTAEAGAGGSVSPEAAIVEFGAQLDITLTPDNSRYSVTQVTVNGTAINLSDLTDSGSSKVLSLKDIQTDTHVAAAFSASPITGTPSVVFEDKDRTFKVDEEIKFKAIGFWQTENDRIKGDEYYVPLNWHHADPSGDWGGTDDSSFDYSASFKRSEAGKYILKVEFSKYVWNGSEWIEEDPVTIETDYVVKSKILGGSDVPGTGDSGGIGTAIALNVLLISMYNIVFYIRRRKIGKNSSI